MTDAEILEAARAWLRDDPDPETRAAIVTLLEVGDPASLRDHFGGRLEFGTAGLRGALGPGPLRMNRALVRRVTAGLGDYLLATVPGAAGDGVVIGYDGRIGSREFAEDAARVLAGKGIAAWLHTDLVPTPQLAHAVTYLGASAGIMVTASHNPPEDNGYKVYWGNGAQIIPPHDAGISAAIDRVGSLRDLEVPPLDSLRADDKVRDVPDSVLQHYLRRVASLRVHRERGVEVVYTALHGVGGALVRRVLLAAGHRAFHSVPEQEQPDGQFPTVRFPNPEEPGAMDLALALGEEVHAHLVIANDPDADRLAVAARDADGALRMLDGNQIGVLMAADLLEHGPGEDAGPRMVATSIVSSRMLETIARAHGVAYADTLTGFKWIANAAIAHEAAGGRFVMGYEEALGYSAGSVVRDKDGVSAALLLVDLAAWLKKKGQTLFDRLEALYRQYGYFASRQRAVTLKGEAGARQIAAIMAHFRDNPPAALGGRALTRFGDLQRGQELDPATGALTPTTLPPSDVLVYQFGPDLRVLVRPSGTEPKIKLYFELRDALGADETLADARARVGAEVDALADGLLAEALAVEST